ncbi:hypothetical protein G9A89_011636 [Geosiphon pyriformis]|nr:hypothetical protein G9A89_011636 [Geosiphon pyriformis]
MSLEGGLYAFGSNGQGQLGIGSEEDSRTPRICLFSSKTSPNLSRPPLVMSGGGNHSAVITCDEELWMSGQNVYGQCGLKSSSTHYNIFHKVQLSEPNTKDSNCTRFRSVACGWSHTLVTTQRGELYVFGKGSFGELGLGHSLLSTEGKIMKIEGISNVQKVACGLRYSIALTVDGKCYGWGNNRYGQLSLNEYDDEMRGIPAQNPIGKTNINKTNYFYPVQIQLPYSHEIIVDVGCGQYHTAVLTKQGQVYTFGQNKYGQLGYASPLDIPSRAIPKRVVMLGENAEEISCGWHHTIILLKSKKIAIWGRNDHGQLGILPEKNDDYWIEKPILLCYLPKIIPFKPDIQVINVVSGSEHSLIRTSFGQCLAWGWNEHGNCATEDGYDVLIPKNIVDSVTKEPFRVGKIGAGCGTSWIWIENLQIVFIHFLSIVASANAYFFPNLLLINVQGGVSSFELMLAFLLRRSGCIKTQRLTALRAEADAASQRAEDAEAALKKEKQESASKDQEILSLQNKLILLEAQVDRAEKKLADSKHLQEEEESSKSNIEGLQRKIALLESELDSTEKNLRETTEKLRQTDVKAEHFERKVHQLDGERAQSEEKYEKLLEQYQQSKAELEETLRQLDQI